MNVNGYDIRPIPRSFMRKMIDLYIKHQKIAATESGFRGWRVARQFSTYWDDNSDVLGCFDHNDDLIGFIAWSHNYISDPYQGIKSVEYDETKGRYAKAEICWHEQLLIAPEHRRRGLGRKLMQMMLKMNNGDRIRNICHEKWLVSFYESFGFDNIYKGEVPQNPDQIYWMNERR